MLPLRGYVFIGLNVIRTLSIIALILVFASNILVMANDIKAVNTFVGEEANGMLSSNDTDYVDCDYIDGSTVPNQAAGVFWAVLNRLLIIFECVILIFSEVGFPMKVFDTYFPVLGSGFGVGALGIFQCLIGAAVLSHHIPEFALVAAFFLFSVGCLNCLLGLIFRAGVKHKRSLTFWRDSRKPVLPNTTPGLKPMVMGSNPSSSWVMPSEAGSDDSHEKVPPYGEQAGSAFGKQGEKSGKFYLAKAISLARPSQAHPSSTPRLNVGGSSRGGGTPAFRSSPQAL